MSEAGGLEATYQEYKDRGFIILAYWAENEDSSTPTSDELAAFADEHGHTFPDLADEGWALNSRIEQDNGIPTQALLAPGAEIIMKDEFPTADDIESVLPE